MHSCISSFLSLLGSFCAPHEDASTLFVLRPVFSYRQNTHIFHHLTFSNSPVFCTLLLCHCSLRLLKHKHVFTTKCTCTSKSFVFSLLEKGIIICSSTVLLFHGFHMVQSTMTITYIFIFCIQKRGGMVSKHGKFGLMNLKYSGHGLV